MPDQPKPCRTTQHCAVHDFCHRCTPSLDNAVEHLVKAIDAAGITSGSGRVYAQLAATVRDAARTAARQTTVAIRPCTCQHPADEHSIYGCADDCACEWMPKRAARQTTVQDDTVRLCTCGNYTAPHPFPGCAEPAPAVGQPAEAQPTDEARPPRSTWRVEGYDADVWLPVSRTFSNSEDAHARKRVSQRYPDMPTRLVRETTTWTVEDER